MAKSNPKKEKAERNKAYARQFRKKPTNNFNSKFKRKDYNNSNGSNQSSEDGQD